MSEYTVGIEEEYQLVDGETGALRGRAPELVAGAGPAKEEFQRTMVEVDTPVSRTVSEAVAHIADRRRRVARSAAPRGLAIAAAGLHPVGPYPTEQVSDSPDYRRVAAIGGSTVSQMHVFGMHVHVGVPSRTAAIRAMLGAATFVPHLLALSASSPFDRGEDTGYASYRLVLRSAYPRVGLPMPVASVDEYDELLRILRGPEDGAASGSPISWDVRPSETYPTLEFRFLDVTPWLDTVALVAALARALTAMFADRPAPSPTGLELQLLRENRWRAARFGLDARFFELTPVTGRERPARDGIRRLVERLAPIADRLGDADALAGLDEILRRGTAADTMRRIHDEEGSYPAVIRWLVRTTVPSTPPGGVQAA